MLTSEMMEQVTLIDGSPVMIRPVRPDDAPRLQAFHTRLSEESILFRFMGHPKVLTDEQAKNMADVDFRRTMALAGIVAEKDEERLIGVARYEVIPSGEPGRAEAAIVVEDEYQRRGLGVVLSDRLVAFAQRHGVHTFVSFILPENVEVLHLLRRSGLPLKVVEQDTDMLEIRITLPQRPDR